MSAFETPRRPEQRPTARVRPLSLPADTAAVALGFDDPLLAARLPSGLVQPDDTGRLYGEPAPVRVVVGQPPIVPPRRPQGDTAQIQLARSLSPAQALALPGPTRRPRDLTIASAQIASLRPTQRPVTLSTRSPAASDVDEGIVLAAASPEPEAIRGPLIAPRSGANPCGSRLTRDMPRRPGSAASGSAVMAGLTNAGGGDRDNALVREALRGNMPSHMRDLQPVSFNGVIGGQQTQITLCVTPDYLAIGSDADHVRVPLGLPAALRVADAFDMMLPTTRMVDAIYAQADLRLSPRPMEPGSQMSSTNYFVRHDATLDGQMASAGGRHGILVAGHKKDLVIADRLTQVNGRVAIYGWHRSNGNPIQPLSTVHGAYYADYSHGIRLVSRTAYMDGRPVDLRGLLTDGRYASLLNNGGPLSGATIRLAALQ